MDYRLEIKPFTQKQGVNYRVIRLTDTAMHTSAKTPTPSLGKKIQKAFEDNKPDRLYFPVDPLLLQNSREYVINRLMQDLDFIKMVQEEEAQGNKVLIEIPEHGIPTVPGKDMLEFMESTNGKRALRGIAKNKGKE